MSLELHYGNAVTGSQRFERQDLQKRLMSTLESCGGVKMFGLRRIGKSTLRLHVAEQLGKTGVPFAFVDAQGLQSVEDLLAELFRALPQETNLVTKVIGRLSSNSPLRGVLEGLAKGTKMGEGVVSAYWKEVSNSIRDTLQDNKGPAPMLIVDEFTFLLRNVLDRNPQSGREQINQLMASMREWREAGMKMLLTGSVGITALSRRYGLSRDHLNDLLPFDVPELSEDEAKEFVRQATEGPSEGRWTDQHTLEFLRHTGVLYPSFLVKGLLEIGVSRPAAPDAFAEVFATRVRPVLHEDFYQQFNKRFKLYGEIDKQLLEQVVAPALKRIMDAPAGCESLDDLQLSEAYSRIDLAEVLEMLVEDGFIRYREEIDASRTWLPASRLARLWWKRSRLA